MQGDQETLRQLVESARLDVGMVCRLNLKPLPGLSSSLLYFLTEVPHVTR